MNQKHDSLLAKIFQMAAKTATTLAEREKAAEALKRFLKQLEAEELIQAVKLVFTFLQARRKAMTAGSPLAAPFEAVEQLRSSGFPLSASSALAAMELELAELGFEHIRLIAFRETTIDHWIKQKAGKDDELLRSLKERLIDLAISDPQMTLASELYSWFARNLDAKRLPDSKPLLVAAAARHHPKAAEMFAILVPKDKSGDFIIGWISDGEERLKRVIELSQIDSRLFDALQKAAPAWLKHGQANLLIDLYGGMHSNIGSLTGSKRAESTAQLLTLAGALLPLAEVNEAASAILQQLQTISLAVWKEAGDSQDRHQTWAIIQAGNQSLAPRQSNTLTPLQAKHLGIAVIRARKGKDALLELESAYVNLGGERFGEIGAIVAFDATIHRDVKGLLYPGEQALVTRSGIRCGDAGIVKAEVTPTKFE